MRTPRKCLGERLVEHGRARGVVAGTSHVVPALWLRSIRDALGRAMITLG